MTEARQHTWTMQPCPPRAAVKPESKEMEGIEREVGYCCA